jgi:integrase
MQKYPTGVENHGGKLRVWFIYKGVRARESLGVDDTPKNRKVAGEMRASICYEIKTGNFDYAARFPSSANLKKFGVERREIEFGELCQKWLNFKEIEVSKNTLQRYESVIAALKNYIGPKTPVSLINQESILELRRELLTGKLLPKNGHVASGFGRSASTVKGYLAKLNGLMDFALDNGYIAIQPMTKIQPLKVAKSEPDPLTKGEFVRMLDKSGSRQARNIWSLAVYTGMRHGEICALAWEDIDLIKGTITVRRNFTQVRGFSLPKTDSGTDRVISLIENAIEVLRDQAELTRLGTQHKVTVDLREYNKRESHECTFVFNPLLNAPNGRAGIVYNVSSLYRNWSAALRRAGIRHRNAYQSRHTYACWLLSAGANPNFIASQMGHANAKMLYQVYGKWMSDNNQDQIDLLNRSLSGIAPLVPQRRFG